MKLRAAVFTLGLLAVPIFSFAQSSTFTPPALAGDLSSGATLGSPQSGLPTLGDLPPTVQVPGHQVNGDGPGVTLGGGGGLGANATPVSTPEPGTWGLMIGGASAGLLALRRRRKK